MIFDLYKASLQLIPFFERIQHIYSLQGNLLSLKYFQQAIVALNAPFKISSLAYAFISLIIIKYTQRDIFTCYHICGSYMIKVNAHASNYSFQGQSLEIFIVQRHLQKGNDMQITYIPDWILDSVNISL